jgi:hypothetical protein
MYKLARPIIQGGESQAVCKLDSNLWIPFDPANTDYQEYLKWVAEGNTPLPADQGA